MNLDQIKENKYSLNLGRYVEVVEDLVPEVEFQSVLAELESQLKSLNKEASNLTLKIDELWSRLR